MRQERLFIDVKSSDNSKNVKVAYFDSKIGSQTILFVHGFGSFSYTWEKVIPYLDHDYRMIRLDLKGFGYSSMDDTENLTPYEQSAILQNFIKKLSLSNFIIIGHSMGCLITVLAMSELPRFYSVSQLILLDAAGAFTEIPEFISEIAIYNEKNPLVRFVNEDIYAYIFLRKIFYDESKITSDLTTAYANVYKQERSKEAIIQSARQFTIPSSKIFIKLASQIKIPTLIIWGAEDKVIDIEDGYTINGAIENSEFKVIQGCGHSPHEEMPEETGQIISDFLSNIHNKEVENKKIEYVESDDALNRRRSILKKYRPKLSKMVDKWSLGTIIMLIFMKCIQLLRKMGLKANENGWRKASGIFLKKEHSKFILSSYNLRYYQDRVPSHIDVAKGIFISRISKFFRQKSCLHWSIEPKWLSLTRKKTNYSDIIEATYSVDGKLEKLVPHFDPTRHRFDALSNELIDSFFETFISCYNKCLDGKINRLSKKLSRMLQTWCIKNSKLGFNSKLDMWQLIDRVMTAAFIRFEVLPDKDDSSFVRKKFATPNIKKYRHPGWGLLNIIVRFSSKLNSADLWMQYHHVPVDGMPMQELLAELKDVWGETEKLIYPALNSRDSAPEIFYSGAKVFRARMFVDFSKFLKFRKLINQKYHNQMSGPATIASMITWGISQHDFFKDAKILFPVDIEKGVKFATERELSMLFIRPANFFNNQNKLDGFIKYQREFNKRLARTRMGSSESYEMLELYSMVHPIFYYFAKYFMPNALSEYVGTIGLSIMRDAEMFLAPLSDLQQNGFIAMGNMRVPTYDGKYSGAVSICGSKKEVLAYIEAINSLVNNFDEFLNLEGE